MSTRVRSAAFGVLAGALLSVMRAPLGLDLLRAAAVDGPTSAAFRAAALLAFAIAIWQARLFATTVPVLELAASTLAGYAIHGLFLTSIAPLGTRFEFVIAYVAILAALHVLGRRAAEGAGTAAESPRPRALELLGLAVAGGGAAIAVESLVRRARLLGLGLSQDETVFGVTFLLAVVLGAAAFGRLLPVARRGTGLLAGGLVLATASAVIGSQRLTGYESPELLGGFLSSVGSLFINDPSSPMRLDLSHLGTWRANGLLAASCLAIPALLTGTALAGAQHPRRLASVLFGAAIATLIFPFVMRSLEQAYTLEALETSELQSSLITIAVRVAAIGAVIAVLFGERGAARVTAIVAATAALATPSLLQFEDAWLFSPWDNAPKVYPRLTVDTADGLFTVEPVRGTLVATLDRRRITPLGWEESGELEQLQRSLALLEGEDGGALAEPRILLVGPLTPARAAAFARYRAQVDRTAPWQSVIPVLEKVLFADVSPPLAEPLSLTDAKSRLDAGQYDLVLVPPVYGARLPTLPAQFDSAPGPAPRSHGWSVPDGTLAVVWLDASADLSATDFHQAVLVSTQPFDEPTIGIVVGEVRDGADVFPGAGREAGPTAMTSLRWRAYQRQHMARSSVFGRLARSAAGRPEGDAASFLELHFAVQIESSPFLTDAEKIEFDPVSLEHLRAAALAGPPSPTVRQLCEAVAEILDARREPGYVLEYLHPIAEAWGPWDVLDYAVVGAYIEFDMDEEVEPRLAELVERDPYNLNLLVRCADWERDQGRAAGESGYLRRVLAVQPSRPEVLVRLARLASEAGAADAEDLLRRALEVEPDEIGLRELLDAAMTAHKSP